MTDTKEKIQFKSDINGIWNPEKFNIERKPWTVGVIKNKSTLSNLPSCLNMPIKLRGKEDIVLPFPYSLNPAINEIVYKTIEAEKECNPDYKDYFAYITVDCRNMSAGKTQRNPGWHIDSMQGVRYPEKLPACHSFLCSTVFPTEFATNSFNASGLSEEKHNWSDEFAKQVDEEKIFKPKAGDLTTMSAYQIHRSPIIKENTQRTFVRVEFSKKKFNRIGDSINPLLPTDFVYEERPNHFLSNSSNKERCPKIQTFNPEGKIVDGARDTSWTNYLNTVSSNQGKIIR